MIVRKMIQNLIGWKHRLENASLQFQFHLFYIGMLMVLVPSITIFCYIESQKILYEVVTADIRNLVQKSNQIADSKLQLAKEYVFGFLADEDTRRLLAESENTDDQGRLYFLDGELKKVADRYFLSSPDIYSVNIMTERYNFGISLNQNYIPYASFEKSELYKIGKESRKRLSWVPTYKFYEMYGQPELEQFTNIDYYYMFSMVKNLRNEKTPTSKGYQILTINFTDGFWDDVFLTIPEYQNIEYFIIDPNGCIISHTDKNRIGTVIHADWPSQICEEKSGSGMVEMGGKKWMISYSKSTVTGWTSVFAIDQQEFHGLYLSQLRKSSFMIFTMIIISTAAFSLAIRRLVVHPVMDLTDQVALVEDNPDHRIREKGSAEFRNLIHTYNRMNDNVQKLTMQNYETIRLYQESKLKELNLQLNPHFIYNVLNLLNLELIREDELECSELVDDVIFMMRYILDSDNVTEELQTDLEYTLHYIDVINRRYDGIYQLKIDVDPQLCKTKVPKFMLQPIVENVFKHAFIHEQEDRYIKIVCCKRGCNRYFSVEDNGSGMDMDQIKRINEGKEGSVGLNMTRERVKYLYGDEAALYAELTPDGGTRICIILPDTAIEPVFQG
ncbi:sensor histidine kinase [Enterocloster citroniae]|uniref:HAMP domain-containing protein n=2 Tax=Enterocloster citroniae TaxID=358743 RepID=A0A0J9CCL7_9FIRM|nr:sensor histidine kinase [Enterocloster citroniae]KMW22214.1 hypothetical protein HMPREF9470_01443 [[Clostridium] citroniae WAL-19142]